MVMLIDFAVSLEFFPQGFILVFSVCCERSFKLVDDLKKEIDRVRGKDVSISSVVYFYGGG